MNKLWHTFLSDNKAVFDNNIIESFSDVDTEIQSALNDKIISDQSSQCYLKVTGADAILFLQGQFSNDINFVTDDKSQLSTYSTPKGRMLAIFRIFKFEDSYILMTHHELKDSILKRLRMFIMMSKVEIEDISDRFVSFATKSDEQTNSETNSVIQNEGYCVVNTSQRLHYFGEFEALSKLWVSLVKENFVPVGYNAWHITDIKLGIPTVYNKSSESFIPQHTNLDTLDAINFKKGCYTGQEIIARLHYLGKQKRKMYLCKVTTKTPLEVNAPVFIENEKSKQGSGNIVDFARVGKDKYIFLAILQIEKIEENIHVHDLNGEILTVDEQPYTI